MAIVKGCRPASTSYTRLSPADHGLEVAWDQSLLIHPELDRLDAVGGLDRKALGFVSVSRCAMAVICLPPGFALNIRPQQSAILELYRSAPQLPGQRAGLRRSCRQASTETHCPFTNSKCSA